MARFPFRRMNRTVQWRHSLPYSINMSSLKQNFGSRSYLDDAYRQPKTSTRSMKNIETFEQTSGRAGTLSACADAVERREINTRRTSGWPPFDRQTIRSFPIDRLGTRSAFARYKSLKSIRERALCSRRHSEAEMPNAVYILLQAFIVPGIMAVFYVMYICTCLCMDKIRPPCRVYTCRQAPHRPYRALKH